MALILFSCKTKNNNVLPNTLALAVIVAGLNRHYSGLPVGLKSAMVVLSNPLVLVFYTCRTKTVVPNTLIFVALDLKRHVQLTGHRA